MKKDFIREMVAKYLLEQEEPAPQHLFKALVMTGPAGSGKSFTASKIGVPDKIEKNTLNTDEFVEKLFPKFGLSLKFAHKEKDKIGDLDGLADAQAAMRQIAKIKTGKKAVQLVDQGQPIFIDTTGEDVAKMEKRIKVLEKIGYDVAIVQIIVPKELSRARDKGRKRTVGDPFTPQIWDDYNKNVVQDRGYNAVADANEYTDLINAEPFHNVFNLGGDVKNKKGEVLFPGRSIVPQVKDLGLENEVTVTIDDMDKVFNTMKANVSKFLAGDKVDNPIGQSFKAAFDVMESNGMKGRISNIPLFKAMEESETVEVDASDRAVMDNAYDKYTAIAGDDPNKIQALEDVLTKAAKYAGEQEPEPEQIRTGLTQRQQKKFKDDPEFAKKVRQELASLPSFDDAAKSNDSESYNKRAQIIYRYGDPDNEDAWKDIDTEMLTEKMKMLHEKINKMIQEAEHKLKKN